MTIFNNIDIFKTDFSNIDALYITLGISMSIFLGGFIFYKFFKNNNNGGGDNNTPSVDNASNIIIHGVKSEDILTIKGNISNTVTQYTDTVYQSAIEPKW